MNKNQRTIAAVLAICMLLVFYKIYNDSKQIVALQTTPDNLQPAVPVTPTAPVEAPKPQPKPGDGLKAALSPESFFEETNDGSVNGSQLANFLDGHKIKIGHFTGKKVKAFIKKNPKGAFIYGKVASNAPGGEIFSIVIASQASPNQILAAMRDKIKDVKNFKEMVEKPDSGFKLNDQKMYIYDLTGFTYFAVIGIHPKTRETVFLSLGQVTGALNAEELYSTLSF